MGRPFEKWRLRGGEVLRNVSPLDALLVAVIVGGACARAVRLAWPRRFTFDEHHFVENARNYLNGKADWNDHPPLGKLFEALAISRFGDEAWVWRLPSLLLGLASIACAYVIARKLFSSRRAGLLAAALFSLDGFFLAYSRTALLDGQLVFFALASVAVAVVFPTFVGLIAAGVLAGLATSIKFTGVCTWLPVLCAFGIFGSRRDILRGLPLALLGYFTVYWGQWWLGLHLASKNLGPWGGFAETVRLMEGHARATSATHPLTSSWPTWFLPRRPITLHWKEGRGLFFVLTTLGNPLVWWLTSLACLGSLGQLVWFGARPPVRADAGGEPLGFWAVHRRAALVLLAGWVAFLAPWVLTRRDPYIYHYLPAYAFGVLLLAGYLEFALQRRPKWTEGLLVAILVVSLVYLPVWIGLGLDKTGLEARLFPLSWR